MGKWARKNILFILGFAGVLVLGVAAYKYWSHFSGRQLGEPEEWGQFGDYLGGTTNPILAFLTLIGVLWTIHLNRVELRDNKKESLAQEINRKQQEIYRLIETIFQSITQSLQITQLTMHDSGFVKPVKLNDVVTHRNGISDFDKMKLLDGSAYLRNLEILKDSINLVRALHKYCNLYEESGGSPETTYFFKLYFLNLVKFLAGVGKITSDIDRYFSEAVGTKFHTYAAVMLTVEPSEETEINKSE